MNSSERAHSKDFKNTMDVSYHHQVRSDCYSTHGTYWGMCFSHILSERMSELKPRQNNLPPTPMHTQWEPAFLTWLWPIKSTQKHFSLLHTFHLVGVPLLLPEGVCIFFLSMKGNVKIKREKRWVEETKPTSTCFLERVTPAREGACPTAHDERRHCQCRRLCSGLLLPYLLPPRHLPFKHRAICQAGAPICWSCWGKLKCFCS